VPCPASIWKFWIWNFNPIAQMWELRQITQILKACIILATWVTMTKINQDDTGVQQISKLSVPNGNSCLGRVIWSPQNKWKNRLWAHLIQRSHFRDEEMRLRGITQPTSNKNTTGTKVS
jgi:hypothetical protein